METRVARFSVANQEDFFQLHETENGECFCAAWWVPTWDEWRTRTAEQNRQHRAELCQRGGFDGYLLYVDGHAVGWCQVGPRDRLSKLVAQFDLTPDPQVWAITCFQVLPTYRRQGLATLLLSEVLDGLRQLGVSKVQAFPRKGDDLSAEELWTGPEAMYRKLGFRELRLVASRLILELDLAR